MCNVSRVALAVKWELYDRVLVITATIGSKIWRMMEGERHKLDVK